MFIKLISIIVLCVSADSLKLKQVIVLSRHNIRSPLINNLKSYTEKKWPSWDVETGFLTPKGGHLEHSFGKYFSDWLIQEELLKNNCPSDEVFVYANTRQRTKETAKAFVDGAFGDCVPVHYKNITKMDPIFFPGIRNNTQEFKDLVLNEIQKEIDIISLPEAITELEKILDFKNSPLCQKEKVCDLAKVKNEILFAVNREPDISGPFKIANAVVDAFLMAYYDGMTSEDVAWGELSTSQQWETLMTLYKVYHDLRFKTNILSKDLAKPLLDYMTDIFLNGKKKFYLLVGHDANINSLTSSMNFKDYNLNNQHEHTPIGGKLVFQKWHDEVNNQDLLRVNYVYQSTEQIRDGAVLSLKDPPQWALLEIKNCVVDGNGFCLWNDFVKVLNTL